MNPMTETGEFPDRGPAVFGVTTATLAVATLFVAGRMLSRFGIVRRTGADDYVIVLAWLLAVSLSLSVDLGVEHGLGRHNRDIDPAKMAGLKVWEYVFSILYNPSLMATKTSILVFYLRLSKNTQPVLRLGSWITLAVVNVAGIVLAFLNIFQCRPVAAAWDIGARPLRCIPLLTEFICSAPVNITTDLAILALPIPVLTSMRLPPRQKTILVLTFCLGIFVTVVDVVRIYYLQQAIDHVPMTSSNETFGQSLDFSWNASLSFMWSAVEVNVGIICACVPTLKPLIIRILPAMLVDPDGSLRSRTMSTTNPTNVTTSGSTKDDRRVSAGTLLDVTHPPAVSLNPPAEDEAPRDDDISIRDFLSTSPSNPNITTPSASRHPPPTTTTDTPMTTTTTQDPNPVFFNFVTISRPRNLLSQTETGRSLRYNALASTLFFLWGFSYGLLNTLNNAVAAVTSMSTAQTLSLTAVYFGGGYFLGPALVGGWLLRRDEHGQKRSKAGGGESSFRNGWVDSQSGSRGDKGDDSGVASESRTRRASRVQKAVAKRRQGRAAGGGEEPIGGFKATFIVGLLVYGVGTIMFWPGAVMGAYGGFLTSSFVVGFGLAVLETAANPFLVLCGPPQYADARLLLAQGVQAVGSVLSGLLADRVFFISRLGGVDGQLDSTSLIDVQWTYLAITLLSVLLALVFYYVRIPEVSNAELADLAARSPVDPKRRSVGGVSLRTWTLSLAIFAQWCYVSAQENMSLFFNELLTAFTATNSDGADVLASSAKRTAHPDGLALSLPNYLLVAHSAFALSRFLAGGVCILAARRPSKKPFLPSARTLLTLSISLSAVFALAAVALPAARTDPDTAAIPVILFFFCEGPIWPLVFSLGLRGQGARTKRAAAWLTMGGCGPAVWPFVSYGIGRRGGGVQVSLVVVVVLMAAAGVYPAFLGLVRGARELADVPPTPREHDKRKRNREGAGGDIDDHDNNDDVERGEGRNGGKDKTDGEGTENGESVLLGRPGPTSTASLSSTPQVGAGAAPNDQGQRLQQHAPWESQILDMRILQD
ncbi:hypothetical protein C7999DRAFT_30411 [Corynascus novoguineensis]|uniref:Rhodopsin domain-containing protein n=1 Tax=Corynascus novoguineensis TaxID=1126955 RepID=A0AAN7HKL4_9PEZI|nr:hypothetical protein C7999DRAFT_30411 [Corynascus novoguineensis]